MSRKKDRKYSQREINQKLRQCTIVVVWSPDDKEWVATSPHLPGVNTLAKTPGEAVSEWMIPARMCLGEAEPFFLDFFFKK
jgi:predicted RNase H-like HicB family nuclease